MPTTLPPVLSPNELQELRKERSTIRLLDVRTPGEYETVHIRGSYNVPLDLLPEHAEEIRGSVDDPVVLVCQSGARARRAETSLAESGMRNLHILDGGVSGWLGAGLPAERGPERLSLERQVRIGAGSLAATGAVLALLVSPLWALLPLFVGSGLLFAGITDRCGMAMVLGRLPYNRPARCDIEGMVGALRVGAPPKTAGEPVRSGDRSAPTGYTST